MDQRLIEEPPTEPPAQGPPERPSVLELVRSISNDTVTLVRKEIELARQEILEAVTARLVAAGALGAAAVMGLFILAFLGLAAAAALDNVVRPWLSRLIVAGGFLLLAAGAAAFAVPRLKRPPIAPEETKRTVKEGMEWAKTQLKR
jgi:hypothetical protein